MEQRILIIEDDRPILRFLSDFLKGEGYVVYGVGSGAEGLEIIHKTRPDLVILDLGLPDLSGETVLSEVRKEYPGLPVIILTAKSGVPNIIAGLNLGADDYLEKPFDAAELLARIKTRLRFVDTGGVITIDDLSVDLSAREVRRSGKRIVLTKTEFDLLVYLLQNKGKVMTRTMILNHVWGHTQDIESRAVDVYIGYLRKKIESGAAKKIIHNQRGVGYYLKEGDPSPDP